MMCASGGGCWDALLEGAACLWCWSALVRVFLISPCCCYFHLDAALVFAVASFFFELWL